MDAVTTHDIIEKLNIKVRTLRRWQELELIPPPTVQPHPAGRGRLATWPAWVMDRCLEIRKLTNEQKTLDEVAELLGSPEPPKRKYRFKDVSERRERELSLFRARESVGKTLRKFARSTLEWPDFELLSQDLLEKALKLAKDGHMPLLFITQDSAEVAPAFLASHYLARRSDCAVIAVIPLTELISEDLQGQIAPTRPVNKVQINTGTRSKTVSFDYIPDFDFKIHEE